MEKTVEDKRLAFPSNGFLFFFLLARQISLSTTKRCADSISNVCIMDERGKRRENSKYLVVRDMNSIRFYKL